MSLTFKILIALTALATILVVRQSYGACATGAIEYNGACYRDFKPLDDTPEVKPSDEKPPKDKMPIYERDGIHADPGIRAQDSDSAAFNAKAESEQK